MKYTWDEEKTIKENAAINFISYPTAQQHCHRHGLKFKRQDRTGMGGAGIKPILMDMPTTGLNEILRRNNHQFQRCLELRG